MPAGVPATLRVRGVEGGGGTWFMLHEYADSYIHAETGIVVLPSGRRLLILPPREVFTAPNRIAWTCPVLLGGSDENAAADGFSMIVRLPSADGVEAHHVDITLQPDQQQIDLGLWEALGLPEGWHDLELVVATEAEGELPAARRWPISVSHLDEYRSLRSRIEEKLALVSSAYLDPLLQDITLPSLAYSLTKAEAQIASWLTVVELEEGYTSVLEELARTAAQVEQVEAGQDPFAGATGFRMQAYRSELDGKLQPYGLYVPTDFDPSRAYPLVVMLHGFTGGPEEAMQKVFGMAGDQTASPYLDNGYIVATPYNRDNIGYTNQIGEDDVWRVVEQVQRVYTIDADRVYLTGLSMGGGGTLHIGLHYPDRFAAIAAVCGWSDWRVWAGDREPDEMRRQVLDSRNIIRLAENGLNLPVKLFHGDTDPAVNVEHSRRMVARLRELEYGVEYEEYPGVGHNSWDKAYEGGRIFDWFDQHRRDRFPEHVVHVTTDPKRYGKSYWTRIEAIEKPYVQGRLEATVEGDVVVVHTQNVARFSLELTPPLVTADQLIRVEVNGKICQDGSLPDGGHLSLAKMGGSFEVAGDYEPVLVPVGGLSEVASAWRVYVFGTGGTEEQTQAARRTAEELARVQGPVDISYAVLADTAVTPEQTEPAILILVGTPATNALLRQVADQLPIRWTTEGIEIGNRVFEEADPLLVLTCPNPLQPDRLLQVVGALTDGFAALSHISMEAPDYLLMQPDGTVMAEGLFTVDWRVAPASGGE
ncbi:MAG: prolyl oligopeptidase family serine peptidase [Gemmatimonadetes bacterium]|nr:prolyl oligopeptidase family serine peptidase [Gemmatimonadota bacterium]